MNALLRLVSALCLSFIVVVSAAESTSGATQNGTAGASYDYEAVRLTKIVSAVRTTDEISVDGRLDESAWSLAIPATDFIQRVPKPGEPATEVTEARILYDEDNLYFGIICFDSDPDSLVVNDLKEDYDFMRNDATTIIIDSLHDRRSGFNFGVTPAGAKRDAQVSNDGALNQDWDGVWDAKVSRGEDRWVAEFIIPFKTLRFTNAELQEWGLQLTRRIMRLNEETSWAPVPVRYNPGRVSLAGTLRGLENIRQGRNLKVKPYLAAGVTQVRSAGQTVTLQSLTRLKDYDAGVDLKYSLTPSLTLDGTVHTDFAQVEVDQQQVNLTRFNVFFPEKRDFFLENSGTFNFGPGGNLVPFFSRRIGLSPAGTPIPIVGGARVTGKVSQYDIGFLAMKTESLGTTPANNYQVGRIKRNLLRTSWIGALATNRDSTIGGDHNRVFGADAHFQFYEKLEFDSYILASQTPGKSGKNQARRFQSAWRDDELTVSGEYNAVQPNFNPEVGFIRRGNMSQYSGDFSWRPQLNSNDTIRNLSFGTTLDYFENGTTEKVETRTQDVSMGITFENTASITVSATQTFDRLLNAFRIRNNALLPIGDYKYLDYTASARSDPSDKISGSANITWGEFWNGRHQAYGGTLSLKPNYHLNIDISYSRNNVRLPIDNGTFTTDLVGTRFIYAFTPRAFLNAFFQYNADTHQVSSNIRFNITHRPLSDLYVVYNDTRDTDNGELVGRALIIKLTNLFNF